MDYHINTDHVKVESKVFEDQSPVSTENTFDLDNCFDDCSNGFYE